MHGCLVVHACNLMCLFTLLHMLADAAETSIDVSFTSSAPVSEADQPSHVGEAEAPSDQGATAQPASRSTSSTEPHAPGKDQTRELKLWQATIKRPSSAQADNQSAATTTADPRKFHVADLQSSRVDYRWATHSISRWNRSALVVQALGLCKSCYVLPSTGIVSFTQGSAHADLQLYAESFTVIMLSLGSCSCIGCC